MFNKFIKNMSPANLLNNSKMFFKRNKPLIWLYLILPLCVGCGLYETNSRAAYWNAYNNAYNAATRTSATNNYTPYVPGMFSSPQPTTNSTKTQNTTSPIKTDNNVQVVVKQCIGCNGSGNCILCSGTGSIYSVMGITTCPGCFGNGKCNMCHGTGTISAIYNPNVNYNTEPNATSSPNNKKDVESTRNKRIKETSYWETCHTCHGTGYESTRRYAPYYGGTKKKEYCAICDGIYNQHYHNPCPICHGNKKVKRTRHSYE